MIGLDIDAAKLKSVADEFGASEKDLRRAFGRALSRTSRTMRTKARKYLREGLDLRAASVLKARINLVRFRPKGSGMGGARLWVGANDLSATAFKGKPRVTGGGAQVGARKFPGAFVGTGQDSGARMVFKRVGRERLPIFRETDAIDEDVEDILDNKVFTEVQDMLMRNFRNELRARTIYGVGR